MSEDIGPGDWVVCVNIGPNRRGLLGKGLILGVLYKVERIVSAGGEDWVCVEGVASSDPLGRATISGGYSFWRFRKINRPSERFMRLLLEPVPGVKEDA